MTKKCHNHKQTYQLLREETKTLEQTMIHKYKWEYNEKSNQVSLPQWDSIYKLERTKKKLHHKTRARGYKTFFMLNSAEHEISTVHKN